MFESNMLSKMASSGIMLLMVLSSAVPYSIADTTITINQQQLHATQAEIKQQGNKAIANRARIQQQLAKINIESLDLTSTQVAIEAAQKIKQVKQLSTQLESGTKYYLYSESIVNDNQQFLSQYSDGKPLDINKTIGDYNAMLKNAQTKLGDNRLLIFISASMPKKTIVNLMQQASQIGAVFIVRGLIDGSYTKTYAYFYKLKGDNTVGIMINPTLFRAFNIDIAPTFALYESSQDLLQTACKVATIYSKVSGEVTVHYALEQLKTSKIANLAQIASNELDVLDNSDFYKRK